MTKKEVFSNKKDCKDSLNIPNIDYEITDNNIIIYNVPIAAEMTQQYNDGVAYKPKESVQNIRVDQIPLTLLENTPDHPDKHLNWMNTKEIANATVGFMTEPSNPKNTASDTKKYADFVIHRTPKTKALETKIVNGESVDTSIGFKFDQINASGEFKGNKYDYIQNNIVLDHNAILIDGYGHQSIGRAPNPIAGIGADSKKTKTNVKEGNTMSDTKLKERIDQLETEKAEVEKKVEEAEAKVVEAEKKAETAETAKAEAETKVVEAEKKVEEAEKKAETDADLKATNDSLTKELEKYKAERAERVDSIKKELLKRSPDMKEMIDSANDETLLKMEKTIKKEGSDKGIGARMNGNDSNNKKVNDSAVNNYFGLKKEEGK